MSYKIWLGISKGTCRVDHLRQHSALPYWEAVPSTACKCKRQPKKLGLENKFWSSRTSNFWKTWDSKSPHFCQILAWYAPRISSQEDWQGSRSFEVSTHQQQVTETNARRCRRKGRLFLTNFSPALIPTAWMQSLQTMLRFMSQESSQHQGSKVNSITRKMNPVSWL